MLCACPEIKEGRTESATQKGNDGAIAPHKDVECDKHGREGEEAGEDVPKKML